MDERATSHVTSTHGNVSDKAHSSSNTCSITAAVEYDRAQYTVYNK
jgi:hypothetical protein